MKKEKGQEIRNVLPEDWLAWAKEKLPPEEYAEIEAQIKRFYQEHKPETPQTIPVTDSEGRVVTSVAEQHSVGFMYPADWFTDPWTGKPRVFTEEEKKKYGLTFEGDLPPRK